MIVIEPLCTLCHHPASAHPESDLANYPPAQMVRLRCWEDGCTCPMYTPMTPIREKALREEIDARSRA